MYKLEVKLKQHTPLIHFQHDQEGATLRASEVKPKLDKFLRDKFSNNEQYKELIKQLPASGEDKKSPYRLFIQLEDIHSITKYVIGSYIVKRKIEEYEKEGFKVISPSPYFSDDSEIKKENINKIKLGLMTNKSVILKFTYLNTAWEGLLKEAVPMFLVKHNFGSRQSKGFGCFFPSELDQKQFELNLSSQFNIIYKYQQRDNNININKIFVEINNIYKKLKSGDRNNESELRKYFNNERPVVEWEKPAIQEKVAEISRQRLNIKSKTTNKQFIRALLGLPELYEYPKSGIKVQVKNKDKEKVERYQSPILFKVFSGNIYMVISNEESRIIGKSFGFEFNNKERSYGEKLELKTPDKFNIIDFIEKSMKIQHSWNRL